MLLQRQWKQNNSTSEQEHGASTKLRVMQWNALADGLATSFINCTPEMLSWNFRRSLALENCLQEDPDILCLEECDHFEDWFLPHLSAAGYDGEFVAKTNETKDGCAVFVRQSRFRIIDCSKFYYEPGQQSQCALILELNDVQLNRNFVLTCTHWKSKPPHAELRERHAKLLTARLITARMKEDGSLMPLILCGDLNCEDDEKSVQSLLAPPLNLHFSHTLPYSTWKERSSGVVCHLIDYVLVSDDFHCLQYLDIPAEGEVRPGFLPSRSYPSDHISLCVDLCVSGK
jgi:nocturnin